MYITDDFAYFYIIRKIMFRFLQYGYSFYHTLAPYYSRPIASFTTSSSPTPHMTNPQPSASHHA